MAAHFPTPTWRSLVAWTVIEYVTKEICRSDPLFGTNLYKTPAKSPVVKEVASNTELARMPPDVCGSRRALAC